MKMVIAAGSATAVALLTIGLTAPMAQRGATSPPTQGAPAAPARGTPPPPARGTPAAPARGTPAASAYNGPRTPDRKPDLNGIWQVLGTAHWNLEAAFRDRRCSRRDERRRGRRHSVPAGGVGEAERELSESADRPIRSGSATCPAFRAPRTFRSRSKSPRRRSTSASPTSSPTRRARSSWTARRISTISTSGWATRADKWEGDTLVVDTVSLGDQTWFDQAGNFHSDALQVVERFTPVDASHINYEVDARGSQGVHAALEDEHDHLSSSRKEPRATGIRMRRARVPEAVQGTSRQAVRRRFA